MIISKNYAKKLEKNGKAKIESATTSLDGDSYAIVTRFDLQRVDHFRYDVKMRVV